MSEYVSGIGPYIEKLFDYRRSLGYSGASHHTTLKHLDRFCAAYFPEEQNLTEETNFYWYSCMIPPRECRKWLM